MLLIIALAVGAHAGKLLKTGTGYSIWWENAVEKVYTETAVPTEAASEISISSAKGEGEAFQLVITPDVDWSDVTLSFSDLAGADIIPKEAIKYLRVWQVYVKAPSNNSPLGRTGWTPDPLPREPSSQIVLSNEDTGGRHASFYVIIKVPNNAVKGDYTGEITVSGNGGTITTIPLALHVWDFSIEKINVEWAGNITQAGGYLLNEPGFMEFQLEHRMSYRVTKNIQKSINKTTGVVTITSTDAFDKEADYLINTLGAAILRFPDHGFFTKKHAWNDDKTWNGIPVFLDPNDPEVNPVFNRAYGEWLQKVAAHLRSKGWLSRFWIKNTDETSDSVSLYKIEKVFKIVHDADSEIRLSWNRNPVAALKPHINLWVPHDDSWDLQFHTLNQIPGNTYWCYNNLRPVIDFHYMRMRSFGWSLYNRRLIGELRWSAVSWPDANDGGWSVLNSGSRVGSAYIIYKPRNQDEKPAVSSMRFENYREGFEDYEYLLKLKQTIEDAQASSVQQSLIDNAQAVYNRRTEIAPDDKTTGVQIFNFVTEEYSKNTELLYSLRKEIAESIEALQNGGVSATYELNKGARNDNRLWIDGQSICYNLPNPSHVELQILSISGRTVKTLLKRNQAAGTYRFHWEPVRNMLTNNVYLCRMTTGDGSFVRRIFCMK